jgi:hypothetical protein
MTKIPTMVQSALVAVVMSLFWIGAHWLVDHRVWSQEAAELYVPAAATWCVLEGWNYVQRRKKNVEVNTALALPPGSTRDDVKATIARGDAPPSNVPTDRAPYLKGDVEAKKQAYTDQAFRTGTGDGSPPPAA